MNCVSISKPAVFFSTTVHVEHLSYAGLRIDRGGKVVQNELCTLRQSKQVRYALPAYHGITRDRCWVHGYINTCADADRD